MKNLKFKKIVYTILLTILTINIVDAQKFYLGKQINISGAEFKLLGISSKTGVANYRYTKPIYDKMFDREIGDIVIGVKDGHIASTIYNLVPLPNDMGVPNSIVDLINSNSPYPMKNINGIWGMNIDNNTISFMRANNAITFGKDRIIFNSSVRYSLLIK